MSYITMSDLGRRHGGGGRGWRGGGGRGWRGGYYGGGYPYYDGALLPSPVYYVDPVGPPDPSVEEKAKAEAEAAKIRAIVAAVKSEMTKPSGMGQGLELPQTSSFYMDPMGPGARDADIDRVARDDEIVDEAIPAREALAIRKAMGLSGMGDLGGLLPSGAPGLLVTAGTVVAGAAIGYFVGDWLLKRLAA